MSSGGGTNLEYRELGYEKSEFIIYSGIWKVQFKNK